MFNLFQTLKNSKEKQYNFGKDDSSDILNPAELQRCLKTG